MSTIILAYNASKVLEVVIKLIINSAAVISSAEVIISPEPHLLISYPQVPAIGLATDQSPLAVRVRVAVTLTQHALPVAAVVVSQAQVTMTCVP